MSGTPALSSQGSARAARLLDSVLFFSTLALIAVAAFPRATVAPWWEAILECATFALAGLWIIHGFFVGQWRVPGLGLFAPLVALTVFAFIQTLPLWGAGAAWQAVSADPYETRRCAIQLLTLALTLALLVHFTSSCGRLRVLACLVLGIGVASGLYGILRQALQHFAGLEFASSVAAGPDASYGQFDNRNHFAYLMEMSLGLALGLVLGGVRRKWLHLLAALPVWAALVLTSSRGAVLAMTGQLLFLALMARAAQGRAASWTKDASPVRSWRASERLAPRVVLLTCLFAVAVVGTVWVGGDTLVSRLEAVPAEFSDKNRTGGSRLAIWRATWQMTKDHTLAGVGFGGYWVAVAGYHDASGKWTPQQAHNDYLEVLASGGVIGGVLVAWFIIEIIRRARYQLTSPIPFRRATCLGALAGIVGVGIHSLVDFGLHVNANALAFTALVALAVADT